MYKLNILPIVKEDIRVVGVSSKNAATKIVALLEQLDTNQELLGYLLEHNHGEPDKDLFKGLK